MAIQRFCFFLTWASLLLTGLIWGTFGGEFISEKLFSHAVVATPLQLLSDIFLMSLGSFIGGAGMFFGAILPLNFKFPDARKRFSWESKDPQFLFRFYQWYGTRLTEYGAARARGEH